MGIGTPRILKIKVVANRDVNTTFVNSAEKGNVVVLLKGKTTGRTEVLINLDVKVLFVVM